MNQGAEPSIVQPGLHSNLQTNLGYIGTVLLERQIEKEREETETYRERIKKNKKTKIHIYFSYLSTNIIFVLLKTSNRVLN